MVPVVGGAASDGAGGGLACVDVDSAPSYADASIGSRLNWNKT